MSTNPLAKRFAKAFAAQGFGQIVTTLIQIVSVPLFISFWGKVQYGEWLLLSAIPATLSIADLSFAAAGGNEMTMLAGAGDHEKAQSVFQSTWALILIISGSVMAICTLLILTLPIGHWLKIHTVPDHVIVVSAILLVGQVVLSQQGAVFAAGYRAGGFYARGVFQNNLLRLVEFFVMVGVLYAGGGFIQMTGGVLLARALGYVVVYLRLRNAVPWLSLGFRDVNMKLIRPLVAPALSYNLVPLGVATNLQGTLFVVGSVLGPSAVVGFNTMRSLSRFVWQLATVITNAVWPELSRAIGAGDMDLARRLHRRACQVGVWAAICAATTLAVVGPWIYPHWTKGKVELNHPVFILLLVGTVLNSLWSISYAVPVSVNRHQKVALTFFCVASGGIVISSLLGKVFGLGGVVAGLIAVDATMIVIALSTSAKILGEPPSAFFEFVRPPFGWLKGRMMGALRRRNA